LLQQIHATPNKQWTSPLKTSRYIDKEIDSMCELINGTTNSYLNMNGIPVPCVFFVKNRSQVLDDLEKGAL